MQSVELSANLDQANANSSLLQIITDFGKDVSASLNLEDTLYAILLNISHLVPADLLEIKTWDASSQILTPYTLEVSGSSRVSRASHSQFGDLTDILTARRKPLLIPDTRTPDPSLPEWKGSSP
jgi:transcriptional regulator with GAF, ATPase, and Fis domain